MAAAEGVEDAVGRASADSAEGVFPPPTLNEGAATSGAGGAEPVDVILEGPVASATVVGAGFSTGGGGVFLSIGFALFFLVLSAAGSLTAGAGFVPAGVELAGLLAVVAAGFSVTAGCVPAGAVGVPPAGTAGAAVFDAV